MVVPLLLIISFLAFVLVRVAPGGRLTANARPPRRKSNGNSKRNITWMNRLETIPGRFLGDLAHGDFGPSLKYRNHTSTTSSSRACRCRCPGLLAFGSRWGSVCRSGFLTAARRGRWEDYAGSFFAMLMVCIPAFVLAPCLSWSSPSIGGCFPSACGARRGMRCCRRRSRPLLLRPDRPAHARGHAEHAAGGVHHHRSRQGPRETALLLKHAFRMAILPVVSYSGPLLADLLTGSFVIESIFQIPGLGTFLVNGSLNRDYTLVVGLVMLYAALLIVLNLLVDLAYVLARPAGEV